MGGACNTRGSDEKVIQGLARKTLKGRDHLDVLGVRLEDNIRMDLREIRWVGVDWMQLAQDRDQ
jgi:hypothetical protein